MAAQTNGGVNSSCTVPLVRGAISPDEYTNDEELMIKA